MVSFKYLLPIVPAFFALGCGVATTPEAERRVVASEFEMDISSYFICTALFSSSSNAEQFQTLGLLYPLKVVYSVFFRAGDANQRLVRAKINYNFSGSGGSESIPAQESDQFEVAQVKLFFDTAQTSEISVVYDITGGSSDGTWDFQVSDKQPSFTYTDSDLATPLTKSFATEATDSQASECFGEVINDPLAGD